MLISGFSDEINSSTDIQFKTLNRLGISYFEPRGIDEKNISQLNEAEAKSLKEKMDKYGIKASSIGSPIGKVDVEDAKEDFEAFKRVIKTANILECKYIRMFSFYKAYEKKNKVIDAIKNMVSYAADHNIILLHENEKEIYGDIASRCYEILSEINSPNLRAVFDPANFVQCGQDTKEAFELLKPFIEYMHIKDCRQDGRVVPAGAGIGNLKFILDSLKADGYNGFLSLEPHLGTFEGLKNLELGDQMLNLEKGGEGTFTLAYNSLKILL